MSIPLRTCFRETSGVETAGVPIAADECAHDPFCYRWHRDCQPREDMSPVVDVVVLREQEKRRWWVRRGG